MAADSLRCKVGTRVAFTKNLDRAIVFEQLK